MKSWLYARVSTAKNDCRACGKSFLSADEHPVCPACASTDILKSQDTENQLRVLRVWMRELGHEVDREYVDRASAKTGEREQFKRMFMDVAARKGVPVLIGFWSLDRLSREGVLETLQYLQLFDRAGAQWKSYTEQYLDSTGFFRDAIISILAALAKQQRVRISENSRAGLERAKVSGTRSGKAIGRPTKIDREEALDLYERLKSYRAVAKVLHVNTQTVRFALLGREKKTDVKREWSEPVWGELQSGIFVEQSDGQVVVRYDRATGLPWCMNHQKLLSECVIKHQMEAAAQ
jgi:DNA invertase Pin-like site-specific DNA recombinase